MIVCNAFEIVSTTVVQVLPTIPQLSQQPLELTPYDHANFVFALIMTVISIFTCQLAVRAYHLGKETLELGKDTLELGERTYHLAEDTYQLQLKSNSMINHGNASTPDKSNKG